MMKIQFTILVFVGLLFLNVNCEYKRLYWESCSPISEQPAIRIRGFDITPMPIRPPITTNVMLNTTLVRSVVGKLKTSITMTRTVSGLQLPIKCYYINGVYFGSCNYDDLCSVVQTMSQKPDLQFIFSSLLKSFFNFEGNPPTLRCPINAPIQALEIDDQFLVPDFSNTNLNFFIGGDFDIKVSLTDDRGHVGCWKFAYTIMRK